MTIQYPGRRVLVPTPNLGGVRIFQPAAEAADWWDPDDEGLSVVAAYRAINSAGTPWPGGPANYAESLVNLANPGTFDLTEGTDEDVVPWAAATGWGFVATALQYFDTGIIPVFGYSMIVEFRNLVVGAWIMGMTEVGGKDFLLGHRIGSVYYYSGEGIIVAPDINNGNLCVTNQRGYRNGILEGGIIADGLGVAISIYIGCRNAVGAGVNFITGDIHAAAIYSGDISASVAAIATAMAAL